MLQIVMAFAPLVFLILYALKTRKMADAMVLATLLAMVLLHRQHFLTGTIDAMYAAPIIPARFSSFAQTMSHSTSMYFMNLSLFAAAPPPIMATRVILRSFPKAIRLCG